MKPGASLPRPRLTLRIGIVGHRLNKLGPEAVAAVRASLTRDLAMVGTSLARIASRASCRPYSGLPPEVRIVSALAEGADRLAVQCAPSDWDLDALLPMPAAEYEHDFAADGADPSPSVLEFRGLLAKATCVTELPMLGRDAVIGHEDRRNQYAALGAYLVRQVDLLVTVWDGRQAEGPGGTALVVADAVRRGVGVIWIDPNAPGQSRVLAGFGEAGLHDPKTEPLSEARIDAALVEIAGFNPRSHRQADHGADHAAHAKEGHSAHEAHGARPPAEPGGRPSYAKEPWPSAMRWAVAFPALRKLSGAGGSWPSRQPSETEQLRSWDGFLHQAGERPEIEGGALPLGDLRRILLPRFVWADALSSRHSQLYRSAYVTIFILAGLSVPIGLLYLFMQDSPVVLDIKAGFVMAELVIISTIVAMVNVGSRSDWHRTWIETRELSELLRLARPLACIGALADLVEVTRTVGGSRESYPIWYTRATAREMRPVDGRLDGAYLRRILAATLAGDIVGQIDYHRRNAKSLKNVEHFLHRWGSICFKTTFAMLVFYLVMWFADKFMGSAHAAEVVHQGAEHGGALNHALHDWVKPLVSVLAAGLPALGAAFAGIAAQGDFGDRAERSEATAEQLIVIQADIEAVLMAPDEPLSLERTNALLLAAARIMLEDVQSWRQTYVSKGLALPA